MDFPRASGVLVHPTSFPGRFGIGDLGSGARRVLDFLAAGGQSLWQVLPLGPTGYGDSPYASFSAFAGNHLLISPELLAERGWLSAGDLVAVPDWSADRVIFGPLNTYKLALLRQAHTQFAARASHDERAALALFVDGNAAWLDDYALFMALKSAHAGAPWTDWSPALVTRQPEALAAARVAHQAEIALHQWLQWVFRDQWATVRAYARERGIGVVGDIAIFVAHDSADVWARPDLFYLDERGLPTVVAGVPPDYFSRTGQRWGNPLYRWDVLEASGYAWWIERIRAARGVADVLRLDHFRGFQAYWEVPASEPTAEHGRWVHGPGEKLFHAIAATLGEVPIIAEDLGKITPAVRRLRQSLGYPGMKVLQFAFGSDPRNKHLPHWFTPAFAVYTGTHDNDTALGWLATRGERERAQALHYAQSDGTEFHWDLIRLALASVANTAIIPLQDVLGCGSEARMNTPGKASGNWSWRCTAAQLAPEISARLAALTTMYAR
ncbi:MAG TPA: 4-alpha-glucanotransferase [Ktedonobacterales bacterium]|nr:4-alpha-glucanotransferase [Ktedonobacterales bacterium]